MSYFKSGLAKSVIISICALLVHCAMQAMAAAEFQQKTAKIGEYIQEFNPELQGELYEYARYLNGRARKDYVLPQPAQRAVFDSFLQNYKESYGIKWGLYDVSPNDVFKNAFAIKLNLLYKKLAGSGPVFLYGESGQIQDADIAQIAKLIYIVVPAIREYTGISQSPDDMRMQSVFNSAVMDFCRNLSNFLAVLIMGREDTTLFDWSSRSNLWTSGGMQHVYASKTWNNFPYIHRRILELYKPGKAFTPEELQKRLQELGQDVAVFDAIKSKLVTAEGERAAFELLHGNLELGCGFKASEEQQPAAPVYQYQSQQPVAPAQVWPPAAPVAPATGPGVGGGYQRGVATPFERAGYQR